MACILLFVSQHGGSDKRRVSRRSRGHASTQLNTPHIGLFGSAFSSPLACEQNPSKRTLSSQSCRPTMCWCCPPPNANLHDGEGRLPRPPTPPLRPRPSRPHRRDRAKRRGQTGLDAASMCVITVVTTALLSSLWPARRFFLSSSVVADPTTWFGRQLDLLANHVSPEIDAGLCRLSLRSPRTCLVALQNGPRRPNPPGLWRPIG